MRAPSGSEEWSLRAERQGDAYVLRAPQQAAISLPPYERMVLEDAMAGVDPAVTAGRRAEQTGRPIALRSLEEPRRASLRRTGSIAYAEVAAKAIVLGEITIEADEHPRVFNPISVALAAGRAIGLNHEEMKHAFGTTAAALQARYGRFRHALEVPNNASEARVIARAFAAGALVVGAPYEPRQPGQRRMRRSA